MFKKVAILAGLVVFGFAASSAGWFSKQEQEAQVWNESTPVAEVLNAFGEPYPDHRPSDMSEAQVEKGRDLILHGSYKTASGGNARRQSRFFTCTNCHNMVKEDPDLRVSDPETRLDYALKNNLAFLQGTTLYGTVNKVSWYNGDYFKKYGDLVKPANKSLRAAMQLCAEVCSQGRSLTDDEMEASLAFLWSLELKLGDLKLSKSDWQKLQESQKTASSNPEMVKWLKSYYLAGSPATFVETPESKSEGYEVARTPDAKRGKAIYDASCLSCHNQQGPSKYLKLDHDKLSLGMLDRHITYDGHLGLYEIVRHGTYADAGHRAYMPHFTAERMSNAQVEDLRAYVEQGPM